MAVRVGMIVDDAEQTVRFVTEFGEGDTPPSYDVVWKPSRRAHRSRWRSTGHPNPASAVATLHAHIRDGVPSESRG
jgi:hypothetical protein